MEKGDPLKEVNNSTILIMNELSDDTQNSMLEIVDSSNKENGLEAHDSSNKENGVEPLDSSNKKNGLEPLDSSNKKNRLVEHFDSPNKKIGLELLDISNKDNGLEPLDSSNKKIGLELLDISNKDNGLEPLDSSNKKNGLVEPLDSSNKKIGLEPLDSSNEENAFNKPELESKKNESLPSTSTIPKSKPRFSLLQEFDPLCACKETIEDLVEVSDDVFKDAHSTPEKRNLEADETKEEAAYVCISAESSICTDETINASKTDIFYPTVEHPEEHNTVADSSHYLDTLSTTTFDDTLQSYKSTDQNGENCEETSEIDSIKLAAIRSIRSMTDAKTKKIMSDLAEKMDQQQQELSELKLQLNAVKQAKAGLELELTQKDEVILKTQAELIKIEQSHKQELKQLREELKENSKLIQKGDSKDLQEELKECKAREAKAIAELSQKSKANSSYERSLDQYEKQLAKVLADHRKEVEEHEITKRHLGSLELAFSDVHSKYEKSKEVIQGYVMNEETLVAKLELALATNLKHEEKYESLKTHAKNQIDKSNLEILSLKEKDDSEINKLRAIIKRLEIKCSSLEVSIQQKIEECEQLAALCDEVTGQKV